LSANEDVAKAFNFQKTVDADLSTKNVQAGVVENFTET
jgi:hypothetical protein